MRNTSSKKSTWDVNYLWHLVLSTWSMFGTSSSSVFNINGKRTLVTVCHLLSQVNLLVASGYISAYTKNEEEPLFRHPLSGTSKPQPVSTGAQDSKGGSFVYFIKGDDGRFHYHLFKVKDNATVSTKVANVSGALRPRLVGDTRWSRMKRWRSIEASRFVWTVKNPRSRTSSCLVESIAVSLESPQPVILSTSLI